MEFAEPKKKNEQIELKLEEVNKQTSRKAFQELTANTSKPTQEFCLANATPLIGHFERKDRKGLSPISF